MKAAVTSCEVARVSVVMDNFIDSLLPDGPFVKRRPFLTPEGKFVPPMLAEHGLSLLVETVDGEDRKKILMDAGRSTNATLANLRALGVPLEEIEAILLSHAHQDHRGGLRLVLEAVQPRQVPLFIHPDVLEKRLWKFKDGRELLFPPPSRDELVAQADLRVEPAPVLLGPGLMSTGEIPRANDFEGAQISPRFDSIIQRETGMEPDLVKDDQALVINVRDKGIVVVAACSHSGIINTVEHARELTGIRTVYGVIGGFHLTGLPTSLIERTVRELKAMDPAAVCPMHCTGWEASRRLAEEMSDRFVLNSVGSTLIF